MKFRTAYDNEFGYSPGIDFMIPSPDGEVDRDGNLVMVRDEGKTRQDQADDADINVIVKRYGLTGQLPVVRPKIPLEADFREAGDLSLGAALRFVRASENAFMSFPADIRARFDNDPVKFVEFVENPANKEKCIELGLIAKPVVPPVDNPPKA